MVKPLIPIVSDCYQHAFNGIAHISTVHARFGDNHLQKDIEDLAKGDAEKAANVTKSITEVPVHITTPHFIYDHFQTTNNLCHSFVGFYYFPLVYLPLQVKPPRFYC